MNRSEHENWTRLSCHGFDEDQACLQPFERLQHLFEACCDIYGTQVAIIGDSEQVTYAELDARANRLTRYLLANGVKPGTRVGIHLERSVDTYVCLLAVLKAHAAFVPMDAAFPPARKLFIAEDAGLSAIVTTSDLAVTMPDAPCPQIALDRIRAELAREDSAQLVPEELLSSNDDLCYILYTSGTTGRPKGVAIEHPSICNFVRVAREIYGIRATDRVYQGMTIAFDFSVEEIWPPLTSGAAIVPGPTDSRRMGPDLAEFLIENDITVMCCVPTLLATIDRDIPSLRLLLVGGEPCPQDLVVRWSRPGRRMLNTYGPTEATVTATWAELRPDKLVTIGRPMPTYTIYLLDEDRKSVPPGEIGEICIAGMGVARGYINRDDLTRERFIPDIFGTPNNPSGRIYRTGDLGRLTRDGEIEYLGRTDTQVKIRGYRVELSEIESVLLQAPEVESAVVFTWQPPDGVPELVACCKLKANNDSLPREVLHEALCQQLPGYMVPTYLETLDELPVLASGKVDRSQLPPPRGPRLGRVSKNFVAPNGLLEESVAGAVADVLNLERVSVEDDFFQDLGGHSLAAAKLVSVLRKDPRMSSLGLGDVYDQPTVRGLAQHVDHLLHSSLGDAEAQAGRGDQLRQAVKPAARVARDRDVWRCGFAQAALLYVLIGILALPEVLIVDWALKNINRSQPNPLTLSGLFAAGLGVALVYSLLLPIAAKWLLIGRAKPGSYPLWSWFFLRWWMVQRVTSMVAPLSYLSGTPLLNLYCRLMGARIGRGCTIQTPHLHTFDLIEIGDETSIGDGTHVFGYSVSNGMLHFRPVSIGNRCFIGSNSVVMPGSEVGDGAWLGDQSLLPEGAVVPSGESWQGSPAEREAGANPAIRELAEARQKDSGPARRLALALGFIVAILLLMVVSTFTTLPGLAIMAAFFFGLGGYWFLLAVPLAGPAFVLTVCLSVIALKRLILPNVKPGLYPVNSGFYLRKWFVDNLMRMSIRMTDSLYATLYLPPFLRLLGVKIGRRSEISTISHITPNLLEIDDESFIADIAHVGPARVYNGTFALKRTRVGRRSFVGNAAFIPSDIDLSNGSLVGVLSAPPRDKIEPGTSWLGSPAIYLPRRQPSQRFPESQTYAPTPDLYAKRLAYEYFRATLPATLYYFTFGCLLALLVWLLKVASAGVVALVLPAPLFATSVALTIFVVLVKKILIGTYKPLVRPLWSTFVWRTELVTGLYENVVVPSLLGAFAGTPFARPILRTLGAKIGRRCYLETTYLTEFDLVNVGEDCAISMVCSLQTHLFEDRVMKMSHVRIGNNCSIGPRSVVLYDSVLEDGVKLDALSLVMKGETLPAGSRWCGAPARRYGAT